MLVLPLVLLRAAVSYLMFRDLYGVAGSFPFTQEILLVFIGALATVLIEHIGQIVEKGHLDPGALVDLQDKGAG